MQVRWGGVIAFIFLVAAVIIFLGWREDIVAFLAEMQNIPKSTDGVTDPTTGLIALGLVGILVVAVVRILKD